MLFRRLCCRIPSFGCILLKAVVLLASMAPAASLAHPQLRTRILIHVTDENGNAVVAATVSAESKDPKSTARCETDFAGRCELGVLAMLPYSLRIQKEGFYAVHMREVRPGEVASLEITLNHFQEYSEIVNVAESAEDIDLARTAASRKLVNQEILNLPYKTTRDFRNVLPLLPGVLQDAQEQIHPGGAAANQVLSQMDGFTMSQPATGLIETRISVDALRSVQLDASRYSAEYGKGSGGVLALETGMGDDRLRFSATNFIPSVQFKEGFSFDKWRPRATFSGPLKKGKAWFFQAVDADYSRDIFPELPPGANQTTSWRTNTLSKGQLHWNSANILTAGYLFNRRHVDHSGLSRLSPVETTQRLRQYANWVMLRNQTFFTKELLLELGLAAGVSRDDQDPLGSVPYTLYPGGTSGSHFETGESDTRRIQWLANLYLPSIRWNGRHQFKLGTDVSSLRYRQFFSRMPIHMLRLDGTLIREAGFPDIPRFGESNLELSGYAQDRWSPSERLLVELGLRFDRDRIIRRLAVAPRFALTYLTNPKGDTKLSVGVGLFYDATLLELVSRPHAGTRRDRFFASDGNTLVGQPIETSFRVDPAGLRVPRVLHWSFGLEQRLPASFFLRAEYLRKRGRNGLTYVEAEYPGTPASAVVYDLQPLARDRYDAVEFTVRRAFKSNYMLLLSYVRSSARSNAIMDFAVNDPVIAKQAGGPRPWDAPNRLLSWGWIPLRKRLDLAFSLEWRDGFPFSLVDPSQRLVGIPNTRRFPDYFSLNLHVERRFQWLDYQWALRVGCNDVTNRENPTVVDNNIDSPEFLSYGGLQHRAFTARIRLIGRK